MKPLFLNLVALLLMQSASAGDVKGNGGGALLCPGKPLEILDFYEVQQKGLGKVNFGEAQTQQQMVDVYLARLAKYSPARSALYRNWAESFLNEAVFLDQIPLDDIDDIGVTLPKNCQWFQIINQNPLLLPPGKRYLIHRDLWLQLNLQQQVGLIFHELIYRQSGSQNSTGLRHLNGLIAADQFNSLSLTERIDISIQAGLRDFEDHGVTFRLDKDVKIENNKLRLAYAVENSEYIWKNQKLKLFSDVVEFFDNGNVKSFRLLSHLSMNFENRTWTFEIAKYSPLFIQFYESGELKEGPLDWTNRGSLKTLNLELSYKYIKISEEKVLQFVDQAEGNFFWNTKIYPIMGDSKVNFYNDNKVRSLIWGSSYALEISGQNVFPKYSTPVQFTEFGLVQSFVSAKAGRVKDSNGVWINFQPDELVRLIPE
jgi:hypothetical protein